MKITKLKNGNLLLQSSNEERQEIKERLKSGNHHYSILADLLEPYSSNGGYDFFTADQAGHLSEAPCISENQIIFEDNGDVEYPNQFWMFNDYMIRSELEELKNYGRVVFDLVTL